MRVVFIGTPEFALPSLEQLLLNHYPVVAVYTQPDKPAGRGRTLVPSPVKRVAQNWGLPVVQPASFKDAEAVRQLAEFKPEVIVVAAFGQILPPPVLNIPPRSCINIHASQLPKYRGAAPVAAAILAGDEFTAISLMLMEKGLDTGPVLAQAQIPISPLDTTGSLTAKLSRIAAPLLLEILPRWLRGELTPRPQNDAEATYCAPIAKEEGEIDWRQPALELWQRVRAFQPWPGCYTRWQGKQLKIIEAVPLPEEASPEAGRVVALNRADKGLAFGIGTGQGVLGVRRVQLEGKQALAATEFLRGQRQFIGAVLPSS
jgi:methionyl-tRNA formyltransferase